MYSERTQVLLSKAQVARLKRIAARDRRSVGAVIRDAVDAYVDPDLERRRRALREILAMDLPVDDWDVMKRQIEESRYPDIDDWRP